MTSRLIHVVGAVVIVDGEVLCARRDRGALAGLWEFPGGKVEHAESPRAALEREIREELRCNVAVGDEVTTTRHAYDFATIDLTTFYCELTAGQPCLTEHAELRWLPREALMSVEWAPADVPAVEMVMADPAR